MKPQDMIVSFNQIEQIVSATPVGGQRRIGKDPILAAPYGTGRHENIIAATEVETRVIAAYPARVSASCNDPRFRGQLVRVVAESHKRADIETADGVKGNVHKAVLMPAYSEE